MAVISTNELLQTYLQGTVFVAGPSTDLTTNVTRQLNATTGEATARLKAMILAAGGSN